MLAADSHNIAAGTYYAVRKTQLTVKQNHIISSLVRR